MVNVIIICTIVAVLWVCRDALKIQAKLAEDASKVASAEAGVHLAARKIKLHEKIKELTSNGNSIPDIDEDLRSLGLLPPSL